MQAIARVNRTYEDKDGTIKESGLIVDYLGIWQYLSQALIQYANGQEKKFDINLEDVEKAKNLLEDKIQIVNDYYIKDIHSFPELDSKKQYSFVMKALNKILLLSGNEKNKFIKIARKIKRLFRITFTIIDKELSTIAKAIEVINSLLSVSNTQSDELLKLTIQNIKKAIENAVNSRTANVVVKSTKINKDINELSSLLESEAKQLQKENPAVAKMLLEGAINSKIDSIRKIRPIFAKKVSEKLQEILLKLQNDEDLNKVINLLIELAKEITDTINQEPEFNDPQLQAFFTILADEKYLKTNKTSEVLRQIAKDLMESTKNSILDEGQLHNKKFLDGLKFDLKVILKTKYNYPPKEAGQVSGILINKIKNTINLNPDYFIGKRAM
jgi:type I restriction enzyme R subunit